MERRSLEASNSVIRNWLTANAQATKPQGALKNDFIYDPRSICHVLNSTERFLELNEHHGEILVGDTKSKIEGVGTAWINVKKPDGSLRRWKLKDAYYVPHFHTNIISSSRCRQNGFYLSERDGSIVNKEGIAAHLDEKHGLWIIDTIPFKNVANATTKSSSARSEKANVDMWHRRMAHISRYTVERHLEPVANDIRVVKNHTDQKGEDPKCDTCELSKSKAIVSRRQIHAGQQPFEVIHADLIDINPEAYNGDKWVFHAICDYTNFHFCMTSRSKDVLAKGIIAINAFVRRYSRNKFAIASIHSDQDTVLQSNVFHDFVIQEGITVHTSAPYAHGQNGKIERRIEASLRWAGL